MMLSPILSLDQNFDGWGGHGEGYEIPDFNVCFKDGDWGPGSSTPL